MTLELKVDDVSKSFGGLKAVRGCSLRARAGAITGLIGPNGAGKTTLFNIVAGATQPSAGRVTLGGRDVTGAAPQALSGLGLARTFQIAHEFGALTARENLMAAARGQAGERLAQVWRRPSSVRADERALRAEADDALRFLNLAHVADQPAGLLSGGQKKLLELGRTMIAQAQFVLLDEVAAGVNRTLLNDLAGNIERLNRERGVTFFMIEHDIELISRLCETVIVMAEGAVLTTGTPAEIRADPRVIEAYFGGAPAPAAAATP